jgi:3-dehydroquinate dehydratase-2
MTRKVLVLHGPNLNLLGTREPEIYGTTRLADIDRMLEEEAERHGAEVRCLQSNHEGVLIDALHGAIGEGVCAIVLNAAGFTHTSVALRDAVVACGLPVIEVHVSNAAARESFRHVSLIAPVAVGQISGFGVDSYRLGLDAALAAARGR